MSGEIDGERRADIPAVLDEIVVGCVSSSDLQLVNHSEAVIVADDDDQLLAGEHGGVELGIEHEIGAVADEHDRIPFRLRLGLSDSRAPTSRYFVAHAGKAELDVNSAGRLGPPIRGDLGRQAARRANDPVSRMTQYVDDADDLRVAHGPVPAGVYVIVDVGVPADLLFGRKVGP